MLKIKVGRKGYIILPKAVRDMVGIEEGDYLIVEVKDGIILKPVRRVDIDSLRNSLRQHVEKLRSLKDLREPRPGELALVDLEEEFMN